MKISLLLTCAGKGVRAGFNQNKLLVPINGVTTLERSLENIYSFNLVDEIVVTSSSEDFLVVSQIGAKYNAKVVLGGETRTISVKNGLQECTGDIVLIHDGARPFVSKKVVSDCIEGAKKYGGVIPVIPSSNTIATCEKEKVTQYLGKDSLCGIQTPQTFKTDLIKKAYALVGDRTFNDDGEVYKTFIGELYTVCGDEKNVKLTYPEDFSTKQEYRFGVGFDCHKLVENRKLILGGVEIAHDKGLLGHSDADVLTHAIMDAMLGACALRDIGYHFPDTDQKYKGANSIELLKQVIIILKDNGYAVDSISASIMAEKPKLLKIIPSITNNLASVLNIAPDRIGITATTLEGLGFVGREEGICVHATATVKSI